DPKIDLARLRSWKESVVKKLTGGLGQLSKQRSVKYVQGRASFENSNTLRVEKGNGGSVAQLRSHYHCHGFSSRCCTSTQDRLTEDDGFHRSPRPPGYPQIIAGGGRRLHRPRTRISLRRSWNAGYGR